MSGPLDLKDAITTVHKKFPDVSHIDTAEVRALLDGKPTGEVQIVDVREPEEFAVSHIPGAINIPLETPDEALLAAVPSDRTVVVYCSIGHRSAIVAQRLKAAGRSNVANYIGSIFAWANSELPLQASGGTVTKVHPYDNHWGRYLKPEHRAF
ncbi:MAG: rhodanese-like domain-containing protein [Hyphomicrobium sp.]|jgi:rhodanese-related sulfurtransferase